MDRPALSIAEWFESISAGDAKNMFIDASSALLSIARGMEDIAGDEMGLELKGVLIDNLEEQVLEALERKAIADINTRDLHSLYKEAGDRKSALDRHPRTRLVQHIVLSINTLKSALAWAQLEKGHGENGKSKIFEDTYKIECQEKGLECDLKSRDFFAFRKSMKNYNTGCNRFVLAYRQFGSIIYLYPRLRAQRFADSKLGPRLKETVEQMALSAEEFYRREQIHIDMLEWVICILEGRETSKGSELVTAIQDIHNAM
ncbi:unnamed protein product [Rhizoctonia solani]|uniref:Uncharacterized protein n=1 Tax=Rhizoctonia solani TaxID=456999 RepID=A0A8H3C4Q9_9AGAM|nr:unnamed protein product [Rhizoctonia solani]